MLNHSEFMDKIRTAFPNTDAALLTKVSNLSSPGVAPEGLGSTAANSIVDNIYRLTSGVAAPLKQQPPITVIVPKHFVLGQRSRDRLAMLMPQLRTVVTEAISVSAVDFTVLETIRTLAEQQTAVATGHSRTMQSKHLAQADGFAHAVDLGAWVNGKVDWSFQYYADIACAIDKTATTLGYAQHIRWGCAWDRVLSDFGGDRQAYMNEAKAYANRHAGSDLIDAPHFEWVP